MKRRLLLLLAYVLLAVAMTWPLAMQLGQATLGYPNIDALDTLMLRGLFADVLLHLSEAPRTQAIYYPFGYPILELIPNAIDHLTAAPLVLALPFPLADNLWWFAVLVLNGLCAHRLGRRWGGSEAAGALAGVAFMLAEPVLREANLHHAPQAMVFWAPLFLHDVLLLREEGKSRHAWTAGLWLALGAATYWYLGLFLAVGVLPLLWGIRPRQLAALAALPLAVVAPAVVFFTWTWGSLAVTSGVVAPPPTDLPESYNALPDNARFIARHGNDLLFWLRRTPMDVSNRVCTVLVAAAIFGGRACPRGIRTGLWIMAGLGSVMLLGPALRWGEDLWLFGDKAVAMPFAWFGSLHPVLDRLTWPERWGLLVPLALLPLAARAPRPAWWAVAVVVESFVVSANLPLQTLSLHHQRCWAKLQDAPGAILELPLARAGLQAPRVGVHRRFHRRPVVNPMLLPPGAQGPEGWSVWLTEQPLIEFLRNFEAGRWPSDPGAEAVHSLYAQGVTAIAVDVEPGGILTEGGLNRYRVGLGRRFGPPIDLGCAWVWWLDPTSTPPTAMADGEAWRDAAAVYNEAHPIPDLDTLVAPSWGAVRQRRTGP